MEHNIINIPCWNRRDLIAPKMISRQLVCKNTAAISMKLSKILKDIIAKLTETSCLDIEAALIGRMLFRMKRVFRHDRVLNSIQKINRCLKGLLELNIITVVKELDHCTYENNGPTKEMLQWLRLSLQRYAALLHILTSRCIGSVPILNNKLHTGHHWNIAIILLGVIGRIWTLARYLCKQSCLWYKQLERFVGKAVDVNENPWLSSYQFPLDLEIWLGNLSDSMQTLDQSTKLNMNEELKNRTLDIREEIPQEDELPNQEMLTKSAMYFNEDFGEVISRDNLNNNRKKAKKRKKVEKIHFSNSEDLLKFLQNEKSIRKRNIAAARTRHLDHKLWNRLYHALTKLLMKLHRLSDEDDEIKQELLQEANLKVANLVKKS